MESVLALRGIRVERDGSRLLDGVDWSIRRGEHWALLGPNGCGKTTLLNVILTYVSPTAGSIELLGQAHGKADWRQMRKCVGLVSAFLDRALQEKDSALDIVVSGRDATWGAYGPSDGEAQDQARDLLYQLGAGAVEHRSLAQLSQGERQRVLIARALMAKPELLILDEPCSGLDPVARESFLNALSQLMQRPSPTVVMVSHHVEELPAEVSHVLLLKAGAVMKQGPKAEVLTTQALSELFSANVTLDERAGRYALTVPAGSPAPIRS